MIVLEDFSKSYGRQPVVQNLSFTASNSSITALAGLNGAGKTTVLKAVCGIHRADSGRIFVNGIDMSENPVKAACFIGFMSERSSFPPFFTVFEFLYHEALILYEARACMQSGAGFAPKKEVLRALERVIFLCDLIDLADKKISVLSNGEKRRTALARSLLGDPAVLVLDEPASGLDPEQGSRMRSLIADAGKTKTVLFSTHLIHEMESLCAKIVILHKGRLGAQGSVGELCAQTGGANLEEAFLYITQKDIP